MYLLRFQPKHSSQGAYAQTLANMHLHSFLHDYIHCLHYCAT